MSLTTFDLYRDIVAIVGVENIEGTGKPRSVHGTGFVIAPGLLLTCWHCVSAALPSGHQYAALYRDATGSSKLALLSNISRDGNGADLATANLTWPFQLGLWLATEEARTAQDVWTAGHPLTQLLQREGDLWIELNPQYIRTYITRQFVNHYGEFGDALSYELAAASHAGLSGAPLILEASTEVVGVIYGNHDVSQIVELAHRDEVTGEQTPYVERIVSHGAAYHLSTVKSVTGAATGQMSIAEYVERSESPPKAVTSRLEQIVTSAQQHGIREQCPACRKGALEIAASGNVIAQSDAGPVSGLLPCAILICSNCGFISQHQLNKLE